MMGEKVVVVSFKLLSNHLPEETSQYYEQPQ
jgi:hypothetical protein